MGGSCQIIQDEKVNRNREFRALNSGWARLVCPENRTDPEGVRTVARLLGKKTGSESTVGPEPVGLPWEGIRPVDGPALPHPIKARRAIVKTTTPKPIVNPARRKALSVLIRPPPIKAVLCDICLCSLSSSSKSSFLRLTLPFTR